jgi:hypothetical protein
LRNYLPTLVLVLAAPVGAQTQMPSGVFRGTLVGWKGTNAAGEFTARNGASDIFFCRYDSLSYIERDHHRTRMPKLDVGDPLEILADRKPGSDRCYARTVQVVEPKPRRDPARMKPHPPRGFALAFLPQGDRSFGGVVVRRDAQTLTLRTRAGERTLLLRPDTRYLDGGVHTGSSALIVNLHVFVRAGEDIYGNLEAYQVMWGRILDAP